MLGFTEESLPGVLVRWVDVAPAEGEEHKAMIVTARDMGLWCCAAVAPTSAEWREAVGEMRDGEGELAVARYCAAFGLPWESLSEEVVRGQFILLRELDPRVLGWLSASSPEQVVALRQRVYGGRPASVVRALKCMCEYAEVVQ